MQTTNLFSGNIQYLIRVNYQRMMAFEQAAFLSNNGQLRSFYAARAVESETSLKELYAVIDMTEEEGEIFARSHTEDAGFFNSIISQKNAMRLLEMIITLEKSVIRWYKKTIGEIKSIPADIAKMISRQYQAVGASQLALQQL